ncbi:MAG: ATP-dependent DNA helicase RecG [Gammaproteobacteria bacterium]|nr:ATP-dependent DNA helicase RecG [Gammaproteobacteria bacterium]
MSHVTQTSCSDNLSLTRLRGVGPKMAERLERIGVHSIQDLLFHLPLRYEDRTRIVPIGSLRPGDSAVVQGKIQLTEIKFARRRMLVSRMSDGTGSIGLRFFYFNAQQQQSLTRGVTVRCYGEVRKGKTMLELVHPEYSLVDEHSVPEVQEHLTAIYPTTEGLHQLGIRNLMTQVTDLLASAKLQLDEFLPEAIQQELGFETLRDALLYVHCPPPDAPLDVMAEGKHSSQQRLAFEELLAHTLSLRKLRHRAQQHAAPVLKGNDQHVSAFKQNLPFELTGAQQRVVEEIETDLQQAVPMQRLVQGDVGSGKTVVAALATLRAVESGYQAAVMAPTEILAEQHYRNFLDWLEPMGIEVAWLSGKLKAKPRRETLEAIYIGKARVIVGTHALFQEGVNFSELGLIVVDEQHRFGVHQRMSLREKGANNGTYPHQLIMTATPIPRTLSMTVYADLDCSVIDELPPGRKPVETVVLPENRREDIVQRVEQACRQGRQVYWVCTLIEESEKLQCQAAEDTATLLADALQGIRVGLVHGRMKPEQKEQVMQQFKAGELDLLVATTVIEVGVDVPNASLMIIENAERLGLSQLHQLRGRVGRGSQESACVLMYAGKLSQNARQRLAVMRESNDGFVIARKDLELRGPGEVLGTRQTGMLQLRIADLQRDQGLITRVLQSADILLKSHPAHVEPLIQRWIGESTRYAEV